jgi:hypothetical protein
MTVHTVDGRQVGDLPCSVVPAQTWTREGNEVSRCDFTIATQGALDLVSELRPWLHWVTVWDNGTPAWTGPVQRLRIGKAVTTVAARDHSTFMWRTRVPTSKAWAGEDPGEIAAELWRSMLEVHGITANPTVYTDTDTEKFDYAVKADSRMLHQAMDDLTKLGLNWSVVAGTPVFGPPVDAPIETLRECDFLVDLDVVRDGVGTFNNVRVQGKNWAQSHVEPMAGLNLQTLVSLDDVFGVANIQRATRQYARNTARIRDVLEVPASASLHADAPVSLSDLVPGALFLVQAMGLSTVMRLDTLAVSTTPGKYDVQVTLESLADQTELGQATGAVVGL